MFQLKNCPSDSVSSLRFAPTSNTLIASSWDSSIYIYTIDNKECIQTYKSRGAVLCCDFVTDTLACSGGLDCEVKTYDLVKMNETVLGTHTGAVSSMRNMKSNNSIVTGSWDGSIAVWDPRSSGKNQSLTMSSLRSHMTANTKIYSLDILDDYTIIAATNTLQIVSLDVRSLQQPLEIYDSYLSYNLRSICALPQDHGYACGCIEGRVRIDFVNSSCVSCLLMFAHDKPTKPYSFKCHRKNVNNIATIFPVNALTVHPTQHCLVTGGSDAAVYFWDYRSKRRISFYRDFPSSISSLSFNHDGSFLAIASSYLYENGQQEVTPSDLFIKPVTSSDLPSSSVYYQTNNYIL